MNSDNDFIPNSFVRIQPDEPVTFSDALYSDLLDDQPPSGPVLTPRFYPVEGPKIEGGPPASGSGTLETSGKQDSISTGTFGNLVKRASSENPADQRVGLARQRIRYNLLRVGPKKSNSSDRVEAWRKYLF